VQRLFLLLQEMKVNTLQCHKQLLITGENENDKDMMQIIKECEKEVYTDV
jgi:hypothetical protein